MSGQRLVPICIAGIMVWSGAAARAQTGAAVAPTPNPTFVACTGNCDAGPEVTIDELIRGVSIALGTSPLETCSSFDSNGDGMVTIEELIQAVNNALYGCGVSPPTPIPTPARTPTEALGTPVPTATRAPGTCAYNFTTDITGLPQADVCAYAGTFNTACPSMAVGTTLGGTGTALVVGIFFQDPNAGDVLIFGHVVDATTALIAGWALVTSPSTIMPLQGAITTQIDPARGQILTVAPTTVPFQRNGCDFSALVGVYVGTTGSRTQDEALSTGLPTFPR